MNENISKECGEVFRKATEYASKCKGIFGTEHLLCGMIAVPSSRAGAFLADHGVDESLIEKLISPSEDAVARVQLTDRTRAVLDSSRRLALALGEDKIYSDMILYTILRLEDSYAVRGLASGGADIRQMGKDLTESLQKNAVNAMLGAENEDEDDADAESGSSQSRNGKERMEGLGVDLTERAKKGKLDPVIGRSKEIERIIQILSRRTKNNPVLIGEPGVGKTAIVEGLAQAIVAGEVPEMLKNKKVFSLDMANLLAGTQYRGEFEKRLKDLIETIKKDGNIILFIDEIHTIVGAGATKEGALDAANILKPQLARGELQTIGATTLEEYRKYFEKDSALERRFQPITVNPPSVEDTVVILKGLRDKYEKHHNVTITDEAIDAAAKLSDRYISDHFLPDKAIDLIDEAASRKRISANVAPKEIKELEDEIARLSVEKDSALKREDYIKCDAIKKEIARKSDELTEQKGKWKQNQADVELSVEESDIAKIVSDKTEIPLIKLTQSEAEKLLGLEEILHKRVIGQDEAADAVARAVRRARAGIKDPHRPIGSFIFLGPTGVGKTELSKALAEAMFGDERALIRIDMSEYMDKMNVSKLIGSAPGYIGYEEGGQLTEKVRRKPHSVILFDEIEKAHPDVFNLLLQILDDGRLTDAHGRTVDFKNTIIIMTSNIGASDIKTTAALGFGDRHNEYETMREKQMDALKRAMRPEFINRIDDIIIFRPLEKEDMTAIADIMIRGLSKRVKAERDIVLKVDDSAKKLLIDKGFNKEYGARPLRRTVQRLLEDELSEELLRGDVGSGDTVYVSADEDKLNFTKKTDEK